MRQFNRADRIRAQMLRDVRSLLDQECANELGVMVTFTDVEVSKDLKYATIFYSVLGNDEKKKQVSKYLGGIKGRTRGQLGKIMRIKYFPEIKFEFDPSIERGARIEELLQEISKKGNNNSDGNL